jgi:hypothetical protein
MRKPYFLALRLAALAVLASLSTMPPAAAGWIDEAKLGILAHDVGILGDDVEGGTDFNGEIDFKSPHFLKIIGSPRQVIGIAVNSEGRTSFLYFDILNWQPMLARNVLNPGDGIFFSAYLGGAVHDGNLGSESEGKKPLGTRVLYHVALEVGYQINPVNSVTAYMMHLSNAGAARFNGGINDIGIRTGFKF